MSDNTENCNTKHRLVNPNSFFVLDRMGYICETVAESVRDLSVFCFFFLLSKLFRA